MGYSDLTEPKSSFNEMYYRNVLDAAFEVGSELNPFIAQCR